MVGPARGKNCKPDTYRVKHTFILRLGSSNTGSSIPFGGFLSVGSELAQRLHDNGKESCWPCCAQYFSGTLTVMDAFSKALK